MKKAPQATNHLSSIDPVQRPDPIDLIDPINPIDQDVPSTDLIDQEGSSIGSINQSAKRWYVIYTKPHSEDVAREELEKKAISVFLPKIRETKFRKYKWQERIQPLFPSYIFARFMIPDAYYDVKWARGVKRIVGSGDVPIPLDDSIVRFLWEQANEEGLIEPEPDLKKGDKVRVKRGPLEGLWGIVRGEIDSKHRVKILMDILHSGAKVELPYSYVERID